MEQGLTIGQLARSAGVPSSTIRFYERRGLLRPGGRTDSNYRYYDRDAIDRLIFIRAAQAAGFELSDITTMLHFRDGHIAPCADVRELVDARLERVRLQLRRLRHVERVLLQFEKACDSRAQGADCPVLDTLEPAKSKCC